MDLQVPLSRLRSRRKVLHSEADFQFALAWELQLQYPDAVIRLEYPPPHDPTKYVDILVRLGDDVYPIELNNLAIGLAILAVEFFRKEA